MKNYKMQQIKRKAGVKTVLSILIGFLTLILVLSCCMFYTTGSFKSTFRHFCSNIVSGYSMNLSRSGSNVLGYIDYSRHSVSTNPLVIAVDQLIPMNSYIAHADDIDFDMYVQAARAAISQDDKKELAFEEYEMEDFMFRNGEIYDTKTINTDQTEHLEYASNGDKNMLPQEGYLEDEDTKAVDAMAVSNSGQFFSLEQLKDYQTLIDHCYIVDPTTMVSENTFQAEKFASKDMSFPIDASKPQILIYHTHSQEKYYDSRPGEVSDSIVGVGEMLANILRDEYGINVIHDTTTYDLIDGKLERSLAYSVALPSIEKTLEYNPSIEAVIDLHRDGVDEGLSPEQGKRVALVNGESCAQIMFFNGLSRNLNGPITYLENPNQENNLAFSFQLFMNGKELYPDLMHRMYLKAYRFNLHLKPRSTLIELGTQFNTVEEAKNSMPYLAEILVNVLSGK